MKLDAVGSNQHFALAVAKRAVAARKDSALEVNVHHMKTYITAIPTRDHATVSTLELASTHATATDTSELIKTIIKLHT